MAVQTPSRQRALEHLGLWTFLASFALLVVLRPGTCSFANTVQSEETEVDYPQLFDDLGPQLLRYYWDQRRFQPERQLTRALSALENVAETVYVEPSETDPTRVRVHVGDKSKFFATNDVDSMRDALVKLREILTFISAHYDGKASLNDLRTATANGFLTALDPHTLVFSRKAFEDFYVHIEGEIFGVGMLVGSRGDGKLTVIEVLKNTPAMRAGFVKGDLIARIDDESTVNMTVNDAVQRIRGKLNTEVVLTIKRKDAESDKLVTMKIPVTRERVIIKSVESKLLPGGIGYVQVTNFDKNTVDLLKENLDRLGREHGKENGSSHLDGLILDLRGNSGGLLTQASAMADLFLESGVLYAIAEREEVTRHDATDDGNEPEYPMVVLCNDASASGAEIVIGALQRNDRALVLGQTTFGKGSVQQLHPLPPSQLFYSRDYKAQLKITVSEYLIPDDISIQENGVVPDFEARAAVFNDPEIDLFPNDRRGTEKDYRFHIVSKFARDLQPLTTFQYPYVVEPVRARDQLGDKFMSGEIEPLKDRLVRVAVSLFELWEKRPESQKSKPLTGATLLEAAPDGLAALHEELLDEIGKELGKRGCDWSKGPLPEGELAVAIEMEHEFTTRPSQDEEDPTPEPILAIRARATNRSQGTLHRVAGRTSSDFPVYAERELLFGKIEAGKTVEKTVEIPLRPSSATRVDALTLEIFAEGAEKPIASRSHDVTIRAEPFPELSYALTLRKSGSDDPVDALAPGMDARLTAKVTNIGGAALRKGVAVLINKSGKDVFLDIGRLEIVDLAAGASEDIVFEFKVRDDSELDSFKFEFGAYGSVYPVGIGREFEIPGPKGGGAGSFKSGETLRNTAASLALREESAGADAGGVHLTRSPKLRLRADLRDAAPFKAWVTISQSNNEEMEFPDKIWFSESQPSEEAGGPTGNAIDVTLDVPLQVGQNIIAVSTVNRLGLAQRRILYARRAPADEITGAGGPTPAPDKK